MTYVRRTTSDGLPLTLWHVARPPGTRPWLTTCGRQFASGSSLELGDELPAREERCTANGCRQRWETT